MPETGPPPVPGAPTPTPSPLSVPPPLTSNGGRDLDGAGRTANARSAAAPAPGPAVTATLSPANVHTQIGQTVTLSLVLMNLQGLEGLDVALAFDPALLAAGDAKAGSLLTMDGAAVGIENTGEVGRMRVKMTRPSGIAGSGMVAGLSFKAIAAGPAEVRVESIALTTAAGTVRPGAPPPVRVTVAQ